MGRRHSLPAEIYALAEHTPATVLLESACAGAAKTGWGSQPEPWTRLFTAPLRVVEACNAAQIPNLFAEIEAAVAAGLYAAGYFTYECGGCFERTVELPPNPNGQPLAWFGIYQRPWLFDHRIGAFLDEGPPELARFRASTDDRQAPTEPLVEAVFDFTEPQYAQQIAAIHQWIRAGDVYQLNFTAPIRVHAPGSSAALYQRLRSRQPVPYGAFLHARPNKRILSFSPELFFHIEDQGATRRITTRPMKGTAGRGRTTGEDRAQAEWLRNDPKNRSENVMIVDLLRNDLGRLANFGSVSTRDLFAVERYPTLWQMTSTVTAELRPGVDFHQIFRALFPCGSITGAPKVRAMQLLARLEKRPRGIYTGAIGFFSSRQTIFNVAIRTLSLDGDRGTMGVGSGIVIDSDAAAEFRECLLKAEFLTSLPHEPSNCIAQSSPNSSEGLLPDRFSLIESLLLQNEYPLIELHLDRLEDSARYFGFACDRAAVKAALLAYASDRAGLQPSAPPCKVRLLLDRDGALHITGELVPGSTILAGAEPLRVRIAPQRTDSQDPMFFHKTTHRPLYAEAFQAAAQAGFDDVLFLNLRDEVTEGAIHNIFIEKDGHLFTPPIECGLLPGVQRRHILEVRPDAEERVLSVQDLHHADAIYLSNAVRGLRRAVIQWEDS